MKITNIKDVTKRVTEFSSDLYERHVRAHGQNRLDFVMETDVELSQDSYKRKWYGYTHLTYNIRLTQCFDIKRGPGKRFYYSAEAHPNERILEVPYFKSRAKRGWYGIGLELNYLFSQIKDFSEEGEALVGLTLGSTCEIGVTTCSPHGPEQKIYTDLYTGHIVSTKGSKW